MLSPQNLKVSPGVSCFHYSIYVLYPLSFHFVMCSFLVFQVPTMGEMIKMWKKNHNTFGILYSWFLAKVSI